MKIIGKNIHTSAELLCQKYCSRLKQKPNAVQNMRCYDFTEANYEIMGLENFYLSHSKLTELIRKNDMAQRFLSEALDQDTVLYRGIPHPDQDDNGYLFNLFNKTKDLQKGDVFCMSEYSFWSKDKEEALGYARVTSLKGILYELILPKGFQIYERLFCILRRNSKFICLDNKTGKVDNFVFNHIKLKLLPRDVE